MKIGYEFEFVTQKDASDIENDLVDMFGEGNKFQVVTDMSIRRGKKNLRRDGWQSWELVTPPQPSIEALSTLDSIQVYLHNTGSQTNYTTGFHVNISATKMKAFDPMTLVSVVDECRMAKTFDRHTNPYCVPWAYYFESLARSIKRDKLVKDKYQAFCDEAVATVEAVAAGDTATAEGYIHADRLMKRMMEKYMTTNVSKLAYGYVEFRMIGGKDYHQKDLRSSVLSLRDCVNCASKGRNDEFVSDYLEQYRDSL